MHNALAETVMLLQCHVTNMCVLVTTEQLSFIKHCELAFYSLRAD